MNHFATLATSSIFCFFPTKSMLTIPFQHFLVSVEVTLLELDLSFTIVSIKGYFNVMEAKGMSPVARRLLLVTILVAFS